MKLFYRIGQYLLLMKQVISKPEKRSIFFRQLITEFYSIGVDSFGIVAVISIFMGAVVSILVAYNLDNPLIPKTMIGYSTREMAILEFSPTIISLILAGKVGSSIASQIGTMRVSEQIDALEIMGINPANFLVFPKLIAAIFINPALIVFSMAVSIFGGYLVGMLTNLFTPTEYINGLRSWFDGFTIVYALIKTVVFAIIIVSIAGYQGYIIKGGSIEVGRASTKAVVYASILIIIFNLILTQLILI
ncbi:MAG: ABC transporter permease [Bacteroidetes bacterium 4572_77]|nr:MAG: ABC transporter permease [Bacteroidetes bacterium 4572_77]